MARESDIYSLSVTLLTIASGTSTWTALTPVNNQVAVRFWQKVVGGTLEISGGGVSYGPTGTSYNLINTGNRGSSGQITPNLYANGLGYPIVSATSDLNAIQFFGQPTIWFSCGGSSPSILAVEYQTNAQDGTL